MAAVSDRDFEGSLNPFSPIYPGSHLIETFNNSFGAERNKRTVDSDNSPNKYSCAMLVNS